MPEKRDFLSELAKQVEDEKRGIKPAGKKIGQPKVSKPVEKKADPIPPKEQPQPTFQQPVEEKIEKPVKKEPIVEQPVVQEPIVEEDDPFIQTQEEEEPVKKPVFAKKEEVVEEDDQPASFHEEMLKPVANPKKKLSKTGIITLSVLGVLVAFAIYWFGFAPHIPMPNFEGKKMGDVSNWAKQNKIQTSAIAVGEPEYSLEVDKDLIISQSVEAGKKVRKDTPITFVVSKGPDPDDKIEFPDIKNMSAQEIDKWKSENKLLKTKINLVYNETVEEGKVISYTVSDGTESDFTRGTTLDIKISKGKEPEGQVQLIDFVGKMYSEAESWAKNKKIKVQKVEAYSNDKPIDTVIAQSEKSGALLNQDATLTLTVSKGKGIVVPNFVGFNKNQLDAWTGNKENQLTIIPAEAYSEAKKGTVISQNIAKGTMVDQGTAILLETSLGLPLLRDKSSTQWIGENFQVLRMQILDYNDKGAGISAGEWGDFATRQYSDDVPKDGIIEIKCRNSSKDPWTDCLDPLALHGTVKYRVSKGKKDQPEEVKQAVMSQENITNLAAVQSFCDAHKMSCYFKVNHWVENVKVSTGGNTFTSDNDFQILVNEGDFMVVEYNDKPLPFVDFTSSDLSSKESLKEFADVNQGTLRTYIMPLDSNERSYIEIGNTKYYVGQSHVSLKIPQGTTVWVYIAKDPVPETPKEDSSTNETKTTSDTKLNAGR